MEANYFVLMYKNICKQAICIISGWAKQETGNNTTSFTTVDMVPISACMSKCLYDICKNFADHRQRRR